MSRDPNFGATLKLPAAFDWIPIETTGISTSIQSAPEGGVFEFAAAPSVGGLLLQQVQMLPPGAYVLEGHSAEVDQPANTRPYWTLACRDGRELGRIELPNSTVTSGRFAGRFVVPADCPVQTLALNARASSAISGTTGKIDWALLQPARLPN